MKQLALVLLFILLSSQQSFACISHTEISGGGCIISYGLIDRKYTLRVGGRNGKWVILDENLKKSIALAKEQCGFSDEEVEWLSEKYSLGYDLKEETDAEYQAFLTQAEAKKIKKTIFNFWKWTRIDRQNSCGATTVIERWKNWTVYYKNSGRWDERLGCMQLKDC